MASLVESIAKIGSNTLLSRILGFVRDLVVARIFGADAATDAFFVAFRIPNMFRRLFAEGAFSMAFVPVLNEYKEKRGFTDLRRFFDDVSGTLGVVLLLMTAAGILAAPLLIYLFAPGFSDDVSLREMTTEMLRLTFPYLFFISLTALAGAVLNTYERFGVPAFTPVLLNVVLIAFALLLAPHLDRPIMALAWGVLVAGFVQLAFQIPFLKQLGLLPRPRIAFGDPGVRRVARLMGPALLGVSVAQISLLLNTFLASFLATGSISWLYYSDRLMEFPLGILAAALGTVILPRLSQRHAANDPTEFSATIDWALRWVLLLGLPAAIGLLTISGPLLTTLFHSGEFGREDVIMASRSLMAYSLGIVGFMGVKVLAPGYYARQDMRTPVRIAVIALIAGMIFNLVLMYPLGHAGLALGTTLGATLNAALLLRGLLGDKILQPSSGWALLIARGLLASAIMGVTLYWGIGDTLDWLQMGSGERILKLMLWLAAGGGTYVAVLLATGVRPHHLMKA